MKSAKLLYVLFPLLMVALSVPAVAGVVDMQFNGTPTGAAYAGVASYPYELSVDGGPNQWMMCLGYNEHIRVCVSAGFSFLYGRDEPSPREVVYWLTYSRPRL
jgi:hypothetical protein